MPIYEFFCGQCQTIYQFFSKSINTAKIPNCPHCENVLLNRIASTFATISAAKDSETSEGDMPPIDEAKMERAMASLAREADKIDENDPRQAAQLMRKLTKETGIKLGSGIEEAICRMERGEDPDKIEEEMGDLLEGDEPFVFESQKTHSSSKRKLKRDDKLYDL